jgi:hypothetical protein
MLFVLINGGTLMKRLKLAALSLAVFLYATAVLAQHGHGMGGGMGSSMGHGSMNASSHGNSSTTGTGSSHQATISSVLDKNPAIGDKIVALTGDKLGAADACTGFKNLGQCVAAAHVSKNLPGMNFYCLRQAMTGTSAGTSAPASGCTTTGPMSLGKAIQKLDPQANSPTESKKATDEAQQDLKNVKS